MSTLIDGLTREYARYFQLGSVNKAPVQAARLVLLEGRDWPAALDILRRHYPADTARAAWIEMLLEPDSGWSQVDPATGRRELYCVPGYDMLCGDVVGASGAPVRVLRPAGQVIAPTPGMTAAFWTVALAATVGIFWWTTRATPAEKAAAPRRRRTRR